MPNYGSYCWTLYMLRLQKDGVHQMPTTAKKWTTDDVPILRGNWPTLTRSTNLRRTSTTSPMDGINNRHTITYAAIMGDDSD